MSNWNNQGMGYAGNGKRNSTPVFNRSMSTNHSSASAAENKQMYNPYGSPMFQRNGSVKNSSCSSFGYTASAGNSFKGNVKKLCSIFESPKYPSNRKDSHSLPLPSLKSAKDNKLSWSGSDSSDAPPKHASSLVSDSPFSLPGTEDRVVIYFTSLRGIRRTFQDCHSVRMIFRGFRVNLDERDISMDVSYKRELQKVLGENNVSLPQVFIKGKHIGGADLIKQLLELGDLARLVKGLPLRALKPCDACDDVRFIPCTNCSGSRKVFVEDGEQPTRCPDCNENGLVRCPVCCW